MQKLYNSCRNIILNNYNGVLDDKTLDILTVAILGLYINDPKLASERIPDILRKLDILSGNEKVSKLLLSKYSNYPWNPSMDSESAMVTRALDIESSPVDEEWTMSISKIDSDKKVVKTVSKTIHELTHLLRFGGITETDKEIKVRDGISTSRHIKETGVLKRKHYYFEEGIVELYTKGVMESLYTHIKDEEDLSFSPMLTGLKKTFNGKYLCSYQLQVSLIETLSLNQRFKDLIDDTFYVNDGIPELITYYNSILGNSGAFTSLSKGLDSIETCIDEDIQGAQTIINSLIPDVKKVAEARRHK